MINYMEDSMERDLMIHDKIEDMVYTIRGIQVMLDRDLAEIYGVETKRLNEAVRNNPDKFPDDFTFELDNAEFSNLQSKISTANLSKVRSNPKIFTEQGVSMLSAVLRSDIAIDISVKIIRTFVSMQKHYTNSRNLLRWSDI